MACETTLYFGFWLNVRRTGVWCFLGGLCISSCSTRGALVRNSIALQIDPIDISSARLHDVNIFVAVGKVDGSVLTLHKSYREQAPARSPEEGTPPSLEFRGDPTCNFYRACWTALSSIDNPRVTSHTSSFCSLGYHLLLYNTQQISFCLQLSPIDHHELPYPR